MLYKTYRVGIGVPQLESVAKHHALTAGCVTKVVQYDHLTKKSRIAHNIINTGLLAYLTNV